MKKLISFSVLKRMEIKCANCSYGNRGCCTTRNCPVWKKLETPEKGLVEMWQMASSYLVLCHLCVHNTQDDQICDHTGFDKRTVKKCKYRKVL